MVTDLHKKVVHNKNIKENIQYYENLSKLNQEECENTHIPVIIGHSCTTRVYNQGQYKNIEYKKCLLCGKDLSLIDRDYDIIFDASNYEKTSEYEDYDTVLKRYDVVCNLFIELAKIVDSQDELFYRFNAIINPEEPEKIRKLEKNR